MKFARRWHWAEWLGRTLGERIGAVTMSDEARAPVPTVVTWVPLHWTRRFRRGFDQAELMARGLARSLDLPARAALRRTRRTAAQSALHSQQARLRNVRAAFDARRLDLTDWRVILVDDVKTTGATLERCTRLLRRCGAERIEVAVAAVADPHMGRGRFQQA